MLERQFRPDLLYTRIVRHYMDKKGYSKERANGIAQAVVQREAQRRTCRAGGCGHLAHDHIRNSGACLSPDCACAGFEAGR